MPTPSYAVNCIKNVRIAQDVYEFAFEKPAGFSFKPGQFVLFDVALLDKPEDVQTRAFSLGGTPDDGELLFVNKSNPGGRASRWIEEALKPGSQATMKGPFGLFTLHADTTKDYLFIGTSTGIAPFRSQILSVLRNGEKRRIDLVFGARTEADLFWVEELTELTKKYDNFYLHLALSGPSDDWKGHRGRVQTLVPLIVKDFSQKSVYVCGSPDMTKEIKQLCLEEWKVPREDLHVEGYI